MKEGVKKANSVKCGQCSHTAKTLAALKYHIVCSHSKTRRQRNEGTRQTRNSISRNTGAQKNIAKKTAPKLSTKPKCPYKCTECDYKCFQMSNLISHSKKVHKKTDESANGSSSNGTTEKFLAPEMFSINKFICSGCDQVFNKDYELYVHMEFVHREDLVCMYLSSEKEFDKWRREVEKKIKAKYTLIKITATKQIYKCAAHLNSESDDTYIQCPSMIIARLINDGYQVVFHKKHFGHTAIDYIPPPQTNTMSINLNGERESLQFILRKILRDTYRESCALNMEYAKKLIDKATELKEYATKLTIDFGAKDVHGCSTKLINKRKLSLDFNNIDKKRRRSTASDDADKELDGNQIQFKPIADIKCKPIENLIARRKEEVVPKILNTFTLTDIKDEDNKSDDEVKPDIATDTPKDTDEKKEMGIELKDVIPEIKKARQKYEELLSNSSFNETYESFVKTNFNSNADKPKKASLAPRNPTNFYNAKKKTNPKPSVVKKSDESEKSDSNNTDLLVVKKKKKKIAMKTKLGQFSPKKSPVIENRPPSLNVSLTTTKFQDYEVQEREDDCNILILKF